MLYLITEPDLTTLKDICDRSKDRFIQREDEVYYRIECDNTFVNRSSLNGVIETLQELFKEKKSIKYVEINQRIRA